MNEPETDDEAKHLVCCKDHGVVDVDLDSWLVADLVIDDHQEAEDCDAPIVRMTEARWEQLKKAGLLRKEIVEGTVTGP